MLDPMRKRGSSGGELELIETIRRGSLQGGWRRGLGKAGGSRGMRSGGVVLGMGDDCAILAPTKGNEVLVTTDFSLEGRHFRRDLHMAESVGHRCLARGLSDIAAMGGVPVAAFLSLALPGGMPGTREGKKWLEGFLRGMRALGERYGVPLAGGDTAESPTELVLADITLVGMVKTGTALRRSGGRPGDSLYCTGRLGGAAAELEAMLESKGPAGERLRGTFLGKVRWTGDHPQMFPEPRLKTGAMLRKKGLARACIDLSDGLSTDLAHLCEASGVGAEVEEGLLPVHRLAEADYVPTRPQEARTDGAPGNLGLGKERQSRGLKLALNGGEDYELLFSAPAQIRVPSIVAGVKVTRIGRLVAAPRGKRRVVLVRVDGSREELVRGGWEHFAGSKDPARDGLR